MHKIQMQNGNAALFVFVISWINHLQLKCEQDHGSDIELHQTVILL